LHTSALNNLAVKCTVDHSNFAAELKRGGQII